MSDEKVTINKKDLEELINKYKSTAEYLEKFKLAMDKTTTDYAKRLQIMKEKIDSLNIPHDELAIKITNLNKQVAVLNETNTNFHSKHLTLADRLESNKTLLEAQTKEIEVLKGEISQLTKDKKSLELNNKTCVTLLSKVITDLESTSKSVQEKNDSFKKLREIFADSTSGINKGINELKNVVKKLNTTEAKNNTKQEKTASDTQTSKSV